MSTETVEMTPQERAEFEAFKAEKARKESEAKLKSDREAYKQLVDECVNQAHPELMELSKLLAEKKQRIIETFRKAISMKEELFGVKSDQKSHTFTNSEGNLRITVGQYVNDNYRDTVNEGITKVTSYIQSLAKDENSAALVKTVLRLLSKDQKGNLKASRVMQLRQMANESGNKEFIDGVNIIQDAYQPAWSSVFIRCETKSQDNAWENIPLSMTEAFAIP